MAEEPAKKTAPTQKPAAKPGGGGADLDIELGILILIIVFLFFGVSGSIVGSIESLAQNVFIYRFIIALKVISGTVAVISIVGIAYVLSQIWKLRARHVEAVLAHEARVAVPPQARSYALDWSAIRLRLNTATDADAALLIIDADALADRILRELGLPGETMGERLITLGDQKFKEIDDLWDAHKLRNEIAHEGAKNITYSDASWALDKYERAFKELGVI
ncbi:MAG: hypothetical protein HY470_00410 [Candidatus Ryanbacteria bacterium]|nr:hypothetical protein [Candidatus Ryanbacteria bacterium]